MSWNMSTCDNLLWISERWDRLWKLRVRAAVNAKFLS